MSDADSVASCLGLTWGYDAWGNRTAQTPTNGSCGMWSSGYTANNQIVGYSYDAAGNLLNDGVHSYTYDAENRIVSVDGGATATYFYDANGRRASKTVGGSKTDFVRDLSGNVVAEWTPTGTMQGFWNVGYVYLNGQIVTEYARSSTYFVHPDHLGSTRLLTAMDQSVYDSMDYLPLGEQIAGGSGTVKKFTGYPRDVETGLDYALFRHYSSAQGRFMQPDPYNAGATNPQSWNGYAYVGNDPLNTVDPTGMSGVDTTPGGCPAEYITCGSSVGEIVGGSVGGGGGGASFGSDIFDAVSGTPGTYLSEDMYGNVSWGFSISLFDQTENVIDNERAELGKAGFDLGPVTSGFNVFVSDAGVQGLIPELLSYVSNMQPVVNALEKEVSPQEFVALQAAQGNIQAQMNIMAVIFNDIAIHDPQFLLEWGPWINALQQQGTGVSNELANFVFSNISSKP